MDIKTFFSANILSFLGNLTIGTILFFFLLNNFISFNYWFLVGYLFYYTIFLYILFVTLGIEVLIFSKQTPKYFFKKYLIKLSQHKQLFYVGIIFSGFYFLCFNIYLLIRLVFTLLIS